MIQKKFDFDNDPEGAVSQLVQTTIVKSGTPVARIATELGKSEDLIYKLANPKATSQNIQLAAAIKIMKITKDHTILHEMPVNLAIGWSRSMAICRFKFSLLRTWCSI